MRKEIVIFIVFLFSILCAQESGQQYERYNILNKNLISTVFTNGGVIGHPGGAGPRGAWLNDNNGYLGDVSPFVGCEIPYRISPDSIFYFHSVTYCLADLRPNRQDGVEYGTFFGFRPVSGYFNASKSGPAVAIYTDPSTWPSQWPDRLNDVNDPGWSGKWNGYFGRGKSNATEETYFAMDDDKDTEFNRADQNAWHVAFKPDSTNSTRDGMGLEVKVRALQWNQFLAQDCIFWLYEITNKSTTLYNKSVFGMLVGTYVGVTGMNDPATEYDDDWSFYDAEYDITYTGDYPDDNKRNPLWVGSVGMVGYAFLESPGNAFDGIDNDNDADDNNTFTNARYFEPEDFDSVLINLGDQIVLIDANFNREVITITGETTVSSMGRQYQIVPGVTKLVEGNVLKDAKNRDIINPNAVDGLDNDLDGIIDENYFLHYYQRREDPVTGQILINKLRPLRYVNYISGNGMNDLMIDERRDDGIDNNSDWDPEFDDVGLDGVDGTGDFGEGDGKPTSGVESGLTGEPHIDGTDVRESDQIGLTSFDYFINNEAPTDILENDEQWWNRVAPGYFDVPLSIVNNEPVNGEDGDFFYGSGYFPLRPGDTQRLSLALVYGIGSKKGWKYDLEDLLKNKETVQKIYDSNYQFPKEPLTPTLKAEVSDGKVILYWDRVAESSFDPVLRTYDFEGYRLYKSTDPKFRDAFIVTDADGRETGYSPIQQWDLIDGIKGVFTASADLNDAANGYAWNLGDDTGLQHFYIDTDVENGRRYFYAVTAYDKGDSEQDIFPAESPFVVTILPTGEIVTGQNSVVVMPGAEVAGYTPPANSGSLEHVSGPADGKIFYEVVNEKTITGNTYLVSFLDTSTDGVDNDNDWDPLNDDLNNNGKPDPNEPNVDKNDLDESVQKATSYNVLDSKVYDEDISLNDTIYIQLNRNNILSSSVSVKDNAGNSISPKAYIFDAENGRIRINTSDPDNEMTVGSNYSVQYQYYPVYKSPYIGLVMGEEESAIYDTDIFDGLQLSFLNYSNIILIDSTSGWNRPNVAEYTFSTEDIFVPPITLKGRRTPNNYQLEFTNSVEDYCLDTLGVPAIPVNFRIRNLTLNKYTNFVLAPTGTIGTYPKGYYEIVPNDKILFFEEDENNILHYTWILSFSGDSINIQNGDILNLSVTKSFRTGDEFVFTSVKPVIDNEAAKNELDNIRVVPNPYVVAHAHETPLPPTITSGRGERKISFNHLPQKAEILIFTSRGEHVITIHPDNPSDYDGTAAWNLKTKENLDVAYGVYFYVVKSPVGEKKGKIAIIK